MSGGTSESTFGRTPEGNEPPAGFRSSGCCEATGGPIDILASLVPDGLPRLATLDEAPDFPAKSERSCPQAGQDWVLMGLYVSHCPQAIPISSSITVPRRGLGGQALQASLRRARPRSKSGDVGGTPRAR